MTNDININCRHTKLKAAVTYSSDRQEDRAVVSCKFCGFSVEIIDKMLTDEMIKDEFNLAVKNMRKGRRIFTGGNGHVS